MDSSNIKVSIILAFYNDVELLTLVLRAIELQKIDGLEVLIADDGSCAQAVEDVQALLSRYSFSVRHLWQPDDGFGKTIILNKAVVDAIGETLIFLDADCVPQAFFIEDHVRHSEPGVCLVGRRVNVFRGALDKLDLNCPHKIISRNFFRLLWWSMKGYANHLERGVRFPRWASGWMRKRGWGIVGCNFSLQKKDLLAINGFDERHRVHWGAEDSDLQRRLQLHGIRLKSLAQQACQIHFDASFFKRRDVNRVSDAGSASHFAQAVAEGVSWTPHGIVKG